MASLRPRGLPQGWYPAARGAVLRQMRRWEETASASRDTVEEPPWVDRDAGAEHDFSSAVVVPHAGWACSGALAFAGLSRLDPTARTVVVIGGHLAPDAPVLRAPESGFETPLGPISADDELARWIHDAVPTEPDHGRENSVEIHLPIIRYLFPKARVVWLRAPTGAVAVELGRRIGEWAAAEATVVVGSTDLTHYGPRFGMVRPGPRSAAHRWVRDVNDRGFIDRCLTCDAADAIAHAVEHASACSPGAAAAAMEFARVRGAIRGDLLHYATSCDVAPDEHLVGYAAITYSSSR